MADALWSGTIATVLPVLCTDGLISRQNRPDFDTICTCFGCFLTRWSAWWQTEHGFAGKVYSVSTWWCNATRSTQVTVALTHRTHRALPLDVFADTGQ